jgi:hypothetical protein
MSPSPVGVTVSVRGIEDVKAKLARFGEKTKRDLSEEVERAAHELKSDAILYLRETSPYPTIATGALGESIEIIPASGADIFACHVIATADHAKYVAQGRRPGSFPPKWAIQEWMDVKGMSGSPFPLQRAIARRGIKPKPFMRTPWNRIRKKFYQNCRDIVARNSKYWRKI